MWVLLGITFILLLGFFPLAQEYIKRDESFVQITFNSPPYSRIIAEHLKKIQLDLEDVVDKKCHHRKDELLPYAMRGSENPAGGHSAVRCNAQTELLSSQPVRKKKHERFLF